jgi:16S rRNA (cytosine1402-N4)-methyltransferase
MSDGYHTPVLVEQALHHLITNTDGIYVDATIGGGGHAEEILGNLSPRGRLIGMDVDRDALTYASTRLAPFGDRVSLVRENFSTLPAVLASMNIKSVNGILFDLGVSSFQLDEPSKGFSFRSDQPLDMRMDDRQTLHAAVLLEQASETDLEKIFSEYGEERHSRKIARMIVKHRVHHKIATTGALKTVVEEAVGMQYTVKSLARIFQALRIAVNSELGRLHDALINSLESLTTGGRLVVISYHSLEDRVVKDFFRTEARSVVKAPTSLLPDAERRPRIHILTKKPITADRREIQRNRRARSAKLRAAERI